MENLIKVTNSNGEELEVEVLDIFTVDGYEDKEYILYTMNKEVDSNNVEVYVSTLERTDTGFNLNDITDELEWKVVQEAVDEMGDL
ncbi:MAG: DUF1292 domain-containing protein [Bacilli bacterium]|nr:DUF1292 domain-containing protein [Bacilli bacterium]